MTYSVEYKPRAFKDVQSLPKTVQRRVVTRIESLNDNLSGDVKKLTNFSPEYRLRIGSYRALFEVEGDRVVVYRELHLKDACK